MEPDRIDNPDGDNSTSGWREHVRHPSSTEPTKRTSAEPANLADEQAAYTRRFKKKSAECEST